MKNIHILPTEKSSKFYKVNDNLHVELYPDELVTVGNQHIYITSDEEIKDGDWFYNPRGKWVFKCNNNHLITVNLIEHKKIILTTDQDLIKDGVQAIDDEFLEWFVKNPNCEDIKVTKNIGLDDYSKSIENYKYKIIIPKKEPKQETLKEAGLKHCDMLDKFPALVNPLFSFKEGAKWQQERSYSEEDMIKAFIAGGNSQIEEDDTYGSAYIEYMKKWFKQFKKK